jgi:prolyl 4-hydroxylase
MRMHELTREWQAWIVENIGRRCSTESMVAVMVSAGFAPDRARAWIDLTRVEEATPSIRGGAHAAAQYRYDAAPRLAEGHCIDAGDRHVSLVLRCDKPVLRVFEGVLSDDEYREVIERSRHRLKRSTIVDPHSGQSDVIDARNSEGTFFALCEDEFIRRIDTRIARLMNWPLENGEGLQILHYGEGGEYSPHFDYFAPECAGSAYPLARGGQRVATLILYLNAVEGGGCTIFPAAGLSVTPRPGCAVYFSYCNRLGQLDALSLHGGAPVTIGEKWIMTKWVRERRYA